VVASICEFVVEEFATSSKDADDAGQGHVSIKMSSRDNNNNNHGKAEEPTPSTSVEQPIKRKRPLFLRLLLAFSLVGNTRAMFRVSPNKFAAIDFIRFLMLVQIIVMHQYYVALGWSAWPLTKRFFNGLLQKTGTESRYAFLRNIHNTDFFFALSYDFSIDDLCYYVMVFFSISGAFCSPTQVCAILSVRRVASTMRCS